MKGLNNPDFLRRQGRELGRIWQGAFVMATIFDVAKEAHVSKSTVSRVVNRDPAVKPETREAVEVAIRKLDYAPSYFAQGIRTKTIAMLVPEYTNMFYGQMFNGVEDVASRHGYMVLVCSTGSAASEKDYIQRLLQRNIDGIVYNTYDTGSDLIGYLEELSRDIPIVFMDEAIGKRRNVLSVYTDGYGSTRAAVRCLAERGCREIGYIRNVDSISATEFRFEGYRQGLLDCGLAFLPEHVYQCLVEREVDYMKAGMKAGAYYAGLGRRPDAVMAAIDLLALGCVSSLCNSGLRVPEDISVLGYDNIALGEVARPALSAIAQPTREMGRVAARMLLERLGGHAACEKKVFDGELLLRQTTK